MTQEEMRIKMRAILDFLDDTKKFIHIYFYTVKTGCPIKITVNTSKKELWADMYFCVMKNCIPKYMLKGHFSSDHTTEKYTGSPNLKLYVQKTVEKVFSEEFTFLKYILNKGKH